MNKKKVFAFDRTNFVLLAVGMVIVIVGLILMSGGGSSEEAFDASIFDTRHVKVAPLTCLVGYLFMVYAIVRRPRDKKEEASSEKTK